MALGVKELPSVDWFIAVSFMLLCSSFHNTWVDSEEGWMVESNQIRLKKQERVRTKISEDFLFYQDDTIVENYTDHTLWNSAVVYFLRSGH